MAGLPQRDLQFSDTTGVFISYGVDGTPDLEGNVKNAVFAKPRTDIADRIIVTGYQDNDASVSRTGDMVVGNFRTPTSKLQVEGTVCTTGEVGGWPVPNNPNQFAVLPQYGHAIHAGVNPNNWLYTPGLSSFALGRDQIVTSEYALAMGNTNNIAANSALTFGDRNLLPNTANKEIIFGSDNIVNVSNGGLLMGNYSTSNIALENNNFYSSVRLVEGVLPTQPTFLPAMQTTVLAAGTYPVQETRYFGGLLSDQLNLSQYFAKEFSVPDIPLGRFVTLNSTGFIQPASPAAFNNILGVTVPSSALTMGHYLATREPQQLTATGAALTVPNYFQLYRQFNYLITDPGVRAGYIQAIDQLDPTSSEQDIIDAASLAAGAFYPDIVIAIQALNGAVPQQTVNNIATILDQSDPINASDYYKVATMGTVWVEMDPTSISPGISYVDTNDQGLGVYDANVGFVIVAFKNVAGVQYSLIQLDASNYLRLQFIRFQAAQPAPLTVRVIDDIPNDPPEGQII